MNFKKNNLKEVYFTVMKCNFVLGRDCAAASNPIASVI